MSTVFMLVGIPGSGKSYYSKQLKSEKNCPIISTDEVRNMHPDWKEELIWPEVYRLCAEYLKNGIDIIYDATNITPSVRQRFKDKLAPYNVEYDIGVYYFPTDWKVCYKRIEKRNNIPGERFFPLDRVESYANSIIPPSVDEGFKFVKIINSEDK